MATDPQSGPGLGDLEKELTCSICTDLLFQPLTLLDCLHTFCGSCLKEWFYTQGSRRSPSSTRYTCPSCRANVRETRPNATVTTLLDMVLTANPERAKPAAERAEIEQRYKHGESVFPPPSSPDNSSAGSDEEDRRILDEVRQLSLQNPRVPLPVAQRSRQSSRTRQTDSGDTSGDGRSRRRREEERAARRQRTARTTAGESGDARERSRRVEHQSSLRSLLSLSSDTETMEEEILRQIFEEGLLDDIDLDNLEPGQEEELSERIADAYRRRHNLLRSRSQRLQENSAQLQTQRRPHGRSQSTQRPQDTLNSPSNPRSPLLEPPASRPSPSSHQRRLSEQGSNRRRRTSPVPYNPASSSDVTLGPALRSSSDIIPDRPRNSHSRPPPAGTVTTRSRRSNSSGQSIPLVSIGDRHRASSTSRTTRTSIDSPRLASSAARNPLDSPSFLRPRNGVSELSVNSSVVAEVYGPARHEARPRPSSSRSTTQPTSSHPEPSISCDSCGKTNIQYDLHKTCSQCKDGNYHLCLRCYRQGRGCLDWKGFETSAQAAFVRKRALASNSPTQSPESQHTLQSFKYSRPPETALRFMRDGKDMTSDDPARRLQQGLFCDRCHSSANGCLWTCNQCNQGDWGFCNRCINQGKCCTHPLLPISYTGLGSRALQEQRTGDSSAAPFNVLTISTRCDACSCPIPTSTLRFHCLRCNDGDYDLCANCYLRFIAISKIRKEDGLNGWRRCLRGHRMIVVGFEDYPEGQRRAIARNLVGGNALKDKHLPPTSSPVAVSSPAGTPTSGTPSTVGDWSWKEGSERRKKASRIRSAWNNDRDRDRTPGSEPGTPSSLNPGSPQSPATAPSVSRRFPPDGGVGLIVHALWSWYPEEGVHDELLFPRGAEITEAENINDDWYWGCYAGMTGLFPGSHVSVVGEIV